jgi:signal transduction histidine kinase/ligand-binding sensor domain-containing protein/ActR/RegA family two-component response regulator
MRQRSCALLRRVSMAAAIATFEALLAPRASAQSVLALRAAPAGHALEPIAERRFDAVSGLRGSTVFSMALDSKGLLWLGAEDGLYRYAGGQWRRSRLPEGFDNQQVRSLLFSSDGARWVGTRRGLIGESADGTVRVFEGKDGIPGAVVFSLVETRAVDGTPRVVAGTMSGLSYVDGARAVPIALPKGFAALGMMVAAARDAAGTEELWAASALGGVARHVRGSWAVFDASRGMRSIDAQFVLAQPSPGGDEIFVGGTDGVFRLRRNNGVERFESMAGAPRNVFRLESVPLGDGQYELWAGVLNGSLHRWDGSRWSAVPTSLSDHHGTVTLLKALPGHSGGSAVYASARSGYLVRLAHSVAAGVTIQSGADASWVTALMVDRPSAGRDALWIGTQDQGLLHLAPTGQVTRYAFSLNAPRGQAQRIRRVALDPARRTDSTVVVIAKGQPYRLAGGDFALLSAGLDGALVSDVQNVAGASGEQQLLAATSAGVRRYVNARWEPALPEVTGALGSLLQVSDHGQPVLYLGGHHLVHELRAGQARVDSLPSSGAAERGGGQVTRLCTVTHQGRTRLFALDNERGVYWRDPGTSGRWALLPPHLRRVISSLGVTDVGCLSGGRLAAGSFSGALLFDVGAANADEWRVLTQVSDADGLPAAGVVSLAESNSAGLLWVGTGFGLGVVDLSRAVTVPQARLEVTLTVQNQDRPLADGEALDPTENDVHVDPILLTYHREELTRYRVRLDGGSRWMRASPDMPDDDRDHELMDVSNRFYHDLAPGRYDLTVWAYDWAGREYGPVHQSFSVQAPLWRRWFMLLAYVVMAVAVLVWIFRWRVGVLRRSDSQLLESERRARDSERRFRTIFEQALDAHLLLEDGIVRDANDMAATLFDVAAPELLTGRSLDSLFEDVAALTPSDRPVDTHIRRDSSLVPVQFTVTTVPSVTRELQHVVLRDLTALRKNEAERAWFESQVREAQKLESLGTLAGGVAHDFNNLLGVIRGNAELGRTALRKGRTNDDNLAAILDASDRARDIVRQILTFSRRSTPTREYVNLSRLILDLQPLLRRMVPRTVQIVIEGADAQHLIMGDPTQLQQLLLNLVSNAEYAMRDRTDGVLTIAVSARQVPDSQPAPHDAVVLQVRDTGNGMSEDVRSRIFEPFFTTKPTGEGTGLGMAVVHGIVVSHGGRAEVLSTEGQGTTFELLFPRVEIAGLWDEDDDPTALIEELRESAMAPPASVATPEPDDHADTPMVLDESRFAGTSIVVVDDEPAVGRVVERALQHYGHVVHVFTSAEAAEAFIRDQPHAVDLLITDQTMPGKTGDLLAEAVHALRPDLPVLILTGFSHRLTPERIAAARAHAVLLKPVELAVLKRAVDDALSGTASDVAGATDRSLQ